MAGPETDLAEVLAQFTSLIMNERVKSYNEGLDAERERCAQIAEAFSNQGRDGHQIAKEIRINKKPRHSRRNERA